MSGTWIIGAAESCDIRVNMPYVSGKHCRLERTDDGWMLEDLGSTNGTFVNGVKLVGRAGVSRSDHITLGRSTELPWPADPAAAATGKQQRPIEVRHLRLPRVGETCIIGRLAECDIVLDFPMVSGRHASLEHAVDGWILRDLGSTNGTFFGHVPVTEPVKVRPGDVIGLGSYRFSLAADESSLDAQDRRGTATVDVLGLSVDVAERRLIGDVSLAALPGELIAVMGPSGAGKSTLLAAIVGDVEPSEGRVVIAGIDVHSHRDRLRGQVGYVPQDDIMHAELTVEQAVWYAAKLRLPRDFDDAEIQVRVAAVIAQVGLVGTESTRIGSAARRGISGGQRKRVNVAMELVTDPPVLVLDEPTSGLSSVDALSLVQQLRKLADAGKTIILTIHQPGGEIVRLLDAVAVLARDDSTNDVGRLVWYGPPHPEAARFFGADTPTSSASPDADAILRGLMARPVADWERAYRATPERRHWVATRLGPQASPPPEQPVRGAAITEIAAQCRTLAERMLAVKIADRWNTAMLLVQAPVIGLLLAAVFGGKSRMEPTVASWAAVSNSVAMTTFLLALAAIWFGCSNAARELVDERAIYRRERMVGLSPVAYLASKVVVLGMACLFQCVVLLTCGFFGCGLSGSWLHALVAVVLASGVGTVIGLGLSVLSRTPETAAAALPVVVLPLVVLGGVLLPLADLSVVTGTLADMMPSRWAFESLLDNEAASRPLIQVPDSTKPWVQRLQDIAEPWFPRSGWRSRPRTPLLVLGLMWVVGLGFVYSRLRRRPQ